MRVNDKAVAIDSSAAMLVIQALVRTAVDNPETHGRFLLNLREVLNASAALDSSPEEEAARQVARHFAEPCFTCGHDGQSAPPRGCYKDVPAPPVPDCPLPDR